MARPSSSSSSGKAAKAGRSRPALKTMSVSMPESSRASPGDASGEVRCPPGRSLHHRRRPSRMPRRYCRESTATRPRGSAGQDGLPRTSPSFMTAKASAARSIGSTRSTTGRTPVRTTGRPLAELGDRPHGRPDDAELEEEDPFRSAAGRPRRSAGDHDPPIRPQRRREAPRRRLADGLHDGVHLLGVAPGQGRPPPPRGTWATSSSSSREVTQTRRPSASEHDQCGGHAADEAPGPAAGPRVPSRTSPRSCGTR